MKNKGKQFLTEKFNDYQSGRISDSERKVIDDWFDAGAGPDGIDLRNASNIQKDSLLNIMHAIRQQQPKKRWSYSQWLKVACMLLVVAGLSLLFLFQPTENKNKQQPVWQSYTTAKAEVKKVILPDGTVVWINAGTQIRLSPDFGRSNSRKLHLDYGEAFFQVKRDTLRPFSITTRDMVTTVLGTSFNIKSHPELNSYQVAVASGRVKVGYHKDSKYVVLSDGLTKDQILVFDRQTRQSSVAVRDVAQMIQWKSDRTLFLDNMTLAQIAAELSRQYNLEVKISGAENTKNRYTLQLQHQDIHAVLRQLVLKTGISYQLNDKILTLNPAL